MSNIFTFRPRSKSVPNSDFLKDADDTVEFGPSGQDVSLPRPPNPPETLIPAPPTAAFNRDWDNQELANIYRVKKLLDAAGVPNDLERGVSDEGDPWCIFCMVTGEVFIHLSRFDGRYILDSPNLRRPISGVDFADLISAFSDGALQRTPALQKTGGQIIKLGRNGKVFLHPATLLAALIWSIYLNSEELVMVAPEQGLNPDGALDDDAVALLNDVALAPLDTAAASFLTDTATAQHAVSLRATPEAADTLREMTGLRDGTGGKAAAFLAAPTPIAVGLSAVAIAFGLVNESIFDAGPSTEMTAAEGISQALPIPEAAHEETDDPVSRLAEFDWAAMMQAAFTNVAAAESTAQDLLDTAAAQDVALNTLSLPALAQSLQTDQPLTVQNPGVEMTDETMLASAVLSVSDAYSAENSATTSEDRRDVTTANSTDSSRNDSDLFSETGVLFNLAGILGINFLSSMGTFESYDVVGVTVQATFDVTGFSPLEALLSTASDTRDTADSPLSAVTEDPIAVEPTPLVLADTPSIPAPAPGHQMLDLNARAFIEYLMSRGEADGVDMLTYQDELVLIDSDRWVDAAPEERTTMTWSLADGGTVSAMGLTSDFIEYDLIA